MSVQTSPIYQLDSGASDGPVIVVGYDGSEESKLAVEVAAQRAGPNGVVVPVHVTPAASSWLGASYYAPVVDEAYQAAQAVLDEMIELDTGEARVEPELIEGAPADALLRIANGRGAREIVVGSRGLGRFRALLGSVSHALLERSDRPVVIVPRGATHAAG